MQALAPPRVLAVLLLSLLLVLRLCTGAVHA
jgi:hypothetical protein